VEFEGKESHFACDLKFGWKIPPCWWIVKLFRAVLSIIGVCKVAQFRGSTYFGSIKECVDPVSIRNFRGFVWGSLILMKGREELCVAGLMYPVGFPRRVAENSDWVEGSPLYCSDYAALFGRGLMY